MAEVLIDIDSIASKLAQKLGPEMIAEISKRQKGSSGGSSSDSGSGTGSKKEPSPRKDSEKKKESLTDKTVDSYREGAASNTLDQDASELRSGRFSGIIGRRIDSAKKIKDKIQEERKKRAEKYDTGEKGQDPSMPELGELGKESGKQKYNILEVKEAKFTNVTMKGGSSGSFGGGMTIPGIGGSNVNAPGQDGGGNPATPGPNKSEGVGMMGKAALAIPVFGAALGAVIGAVSTMAGMHQQAMQSQEGTLGAFGKYADGGGGIVRNAEVAQIGISRARVLGGSAAGQDFDTEGSKLGAQFGVTQGIGGTAGAEMFAKLGKYGGFEENESALKKIMSDGIRSGFSGLRQAEFMQQVSGISESAYNSGMGIQSADQVSGALSNLRDAGIRDNRLGSVYNAMNENMTKDGGQMNSMLIAHHMQQNGGDYLAAMASAEEGMGSRGNIAAINQMTQGMDPKTKAIWMKKQGFISATEGQTSVRSGKDILTEAAKITTSNDQAANYGERAASDVRNYGGQEFIRHANELDSLAALDTAFKDAYKAQNMIFDLMVDLAKKANATYETVKSFL